MLAALLTHDELSSMLSGLWVSIKLTGLILAVGLPTGLGLALMVEARFRVVRILALGIVEVGRGSPALVLLYLVYYGLPSKGLVLSAYMSVAVALGLNTGAYACEVFRSALHAVPAGQREAALSLGLPRTAAFGRVVLPQALRIVVPQLMSFSILVFQGTALCFSVALPELLSQAYGIGSNTFLYLKILVIAALMYAAISMPTSQVATWLERRLTARL